MENASKALLIVAGVLIGIMILSIAVYLAVTFGQTASEVNEEIRDNQVAQFNSQFTKYDGKQVTIHDIITMANIARTNNDEYELDNNSNAGNPNSFYITITKGTTTKMELIVDDYLKNKMNQEYDNDELKKYTCTVEISPVTGRVFRVVCN